MFDRVHRALCSTKAFRDALIQSPSRSYAWTSVMKPSEDQPGLQLVLGTLSGEHVAITVHGRSFPVAREDDANLNAGCGRDCKAYTFNYGRAFRRAPCSGVWHRDSRRRRLFREDGWLARREASPQQGKTKQAACKHTRLVSSRSSRPSVQNALNTKAAKDAK